MFQLGNGFINFLEPVGSVAPKINTADKGNIATVGLGQNISILCPAQSYPIAAFR